MATLTIALTAMLNERLSEVPAGLTAAVSSLTAAQRDAFVMAWINASEEQRQRPATEWVLTEDDRAAFTKFQTAMNIDGVRA